MTEKRILNGWYKLRWQILERDNFSCQYCGRAAPDVMLEVDHKTALADGGTDAPENLISSCIACNRGKSGLRQSILLAKARKTALRDNQARPISKILVALKHGKMDVKSLCLRVEMSENYVRSKLSKLKRKGIVTNIETGIWSLLP